MKAAETKYFDYSLENRQLYHNLGASPSPPGILIPVNVTSVGEWFDPWRHIERGTDRMNRIGESITPRGISLKIYLANKQDRPNCMIRVIVASLPRVHTGNVVTTNVFDPFQLANAGVNGNNMLFPADKDEGVRFLYDKMHTVKQDYGFPQAGQTLKEKTKMVKLWIKSKGRNIQYQTFTNIVTNRPLAVYIIPYEQYSTLTTDNVASFAGIMRMYYKDV